MVPCTPTKRSRIYVLKEFGWSNAQIARDLGISPQTVTRHWNRIKDNANFYQEIPRPGRPRLLSDREVRVACREITSGQCRTAADVQRRVFPHISKSLMRRTLSEQGLYGRVMRKKPYLTPRHRKARRIWAASKLAWTESDWKKVIISDESKFNLFGSDGRQYCRRRAGEELQEKNVKKTMKHGGGKVTVWGCVTWNGTGRLYRVNGLMNAVQLCQIYEEALLGTLTDHSMNISDMIFQQDNDPKHTSKMATRWMQGHMIHQLPWPAYSPDQSIIENLWDLLDDRVRACNPLPKNENQLWVALQEEWARITPETIQHYYRSIPRRVRALYRAKGGYTKY